MTPSGQALISAAPRNTRQKFMQRVRDPGGASAFRDFTRAEMGEMMDRVDERCKSFFGG